VTLGDRMNDFQWHKVGPKGWLGVWEVYIVATGEAVDVEEGEDKDEALLVVARLKEDGIEAAIRLIEG
jgi:hypothetical protein